MFKKYISKLEIIIAIAQSLLTPKQFIFLSAVLVGISSAFAVIVLKTFAHWVFTFATYVSGILKLGFVNSILPIIGILLTVFVVKKVLGGTIQKGTSQILYAVAKKASIIPKKQMYAQIVTSSLTVGLGGSAGLESPIVITGAAFGSNYAQKYKLSYKDRTLLIGCGVAAGIAAAFNAPIAGVLFAIEVLLVNVSIAAFTPIMIAAATGALVSVIVLDEEILLSFKQQESFDYHNIAFYILLGLITGFISVYYSRNFQKVELYFDRLKLSPYKKALYGSSILAILIFIFPTLFGEGYESIKTLSENDPGKLMENTLFSGFRNNSWALLVFVGLTMMVKVFATGITLGSGGNGGNFAPSLFLGSYVGFFFSKFLNLTGLTKLPVSNFTLVGMAGILSGLFHAPLTAIFLIAEITGGYELFIPLMIVSSISFLVSRYYLPHNIYATELAKKGELITHDKDKNVLMLMDIDKVIETNFIVLKPEMDLGDIIQNAVIKSSRNHFPVVNDDNEFLGILLLDDIRSIMFEQQLYKKVKVNSLMQTAPAIIDYDKDTMEVIMEKFKETVAWNLPVIKDGKYYGFISKSRLLTAYRRKLINVTA